MLGFHAEWAGGEPEVLDGELEAVGWFSADDLRGRRASSCPPRLAIARSLIDEWLADRGGRRLGGVRAGFGAKLDLVEVQAVGRRLQLGLAHDGARGELSTVPQAGRSSPWSSSPCSFSPWSSSPGGWSSSPW